ncbi:hypothetical protein AGMMS49543_28650 [Betaproteobacteria bacterium]|nr:hypothetical protein AGMMS49543_28650 [Betaproteobacteria bacterium]GHU25428.1 hypothetical protein AGMMS50243_29230 [Betaproteobacteria bacterium]
MILNKDKIAAAYTAFRADYEAGKLAAAPLASKLAMTVRSATAEENYAWLGGLHNEVQHPQIW